MSKFGIGFAVPWIAPQQENQVDIENHREAGEFGDGATIRTDITRPIMGIENRTPLEVFDIMVDRIKSAPPVEWRCFHCGDEFTDPDAAREHFGPTMDSEPICQVTAERYREVERRLQEYQNESDATSRTFYDIGHRAAVAERDAEQKGYDRGIADAKAHPAELGLQRAITQGDIDMAMHHARTAFYLAPPPPSGDLKPLLERALAKMVECLKS